MVTLTPADGAAIDNTGTLLKALAEAKAKGDNLVLPPGVWAYSDVLPLEGVSLVGEIGAVLHSLNPAKAAVYMRGAGVSISGVKFTGATPAARSAANASCRIVVEGASGFIIEDVDVDSGAGSAIMVTRASTRGHIVRARLSNTLADSIHITDRSSYVTIEDNTIINSGDDGVAVVGYRKDISPPHHIVARRCEIRDNRGGRCMSVVGGTDVLYENNAMSGNVHAAGVLVAQESSYKTFGSERVMVRFNEIRNCGNAAKGHYAMLVANSGEAPNVDITLRRNLVMQDDTRGGVRALGKLDTGLAVEENLVLAVTQTHVVTPGVVVTPYAGGRVGVDWGSA